MAKEKAVRRRKYVTRDVAGERERFTTPLMAQLGAGIAVLIQDTRKGGDDYAE